MNLAMGSHTFREVTVPLLWGSRAILEDDAGRLSVIDLAGDKAHLEILGDKPAPGVAFTPTIDGIAILSPQREELYLYSPAERRLSTDRLNLPDCQILPDKILVGTNAFSSNMVSGFGVGIAITEHGISIGGPLPPGLARLNAEAS